MTTSEDYVEESGLLVGRPLHEFATTEALPAAGVDPGRFWEGLAGLIADLGPRNGELLEVRASMQAAIDRWHRDHRGEPHDPAAYRAFLEELGYLLPEGPAFSIDTDDVDPEMSTIAGPQLVVPVMNARYALNAANARWGSLYDAVYGTDVLGDEPSGGPYDPARGTRVIAWVRSFLDDTVPLASGSHADATAYRAVDGTLEVTLGDGSTTGLADPSLFAGYQGDPGEPSNVLLVHHGLGVEIVVDRSHPIGRDDPAGVADVVLEAAITAIMDCEDSVAAVDAEDKALAYHNWLGLIRGDLTEEVTKDGRTFTRSLRPDRTFTAPDGTETTRPGRSVMLIRNVGHLMDTPAILDAARRPVPEGLVDAMFTTLCAMPDLARAAGDADAPYPEMANSRTASVYMVKPKMHGPDEVTFSEEICTRVEDVLGLDRNTIKLGIMDEERRTTVNLAECIRAAKSRVVFINTGFLDRTGDEIRTSMEAGPMVPKTSMKGERWMQAYEEWNVDVGLSCGLLGRAQIGKGMWAAPNRMAAMLEEKIAQPLAGATCAWVPSPTAATLHAVHYHRVDVAERQAELLSQITESGRRRTIDELLHIPVAGSTDWSDDVIQAELDNNAQGILGYVVRWVDQGVGCSTVPDINDVGLMEDRATCRISSQHMANWLHHGVVDRDRVVETFKRMAVVVDRQNADDPNYTPMAPDYDGPAFRAACDLVLSGIEQPSGYTEPILHARRAERKAADAGS